MLQETPVGAMPHEEQHMQIEELRRRLRRAHARMGQEGRLAFTVNQEPGEPCFLTHWLKPDGAAFEDCRVIAQGSLAQCLDALDRYAAAYRPRPTLEEVGRTIGVLPPRPGTYSVAAE